MKPNPFRVSGHNTFHHEPRTFSSQQRTFDQPASWTLGEMAHARLDRGSGRHDYKDSETLISAGFLGINCTILDKRVVIDHGWLCYENLMDIESFARKGRTLEGLFRSKSNNKIGNRSTQIKTTAQKGRLVYVIEVVLKGYKGNYIVIDRVSHKIIPSQFGELFSPDWNKDHPEAIRQIRHRQ